jgi:hypothetical protein
MAAVFPQSVQQAGHRPRISPDFVGIPFLGVYFFQNDGRNHDFMFIKRKYRPGIMQQHIGIQYKYLSHTFSLH